MYVSQISQTCICLLWTVGKAFLLNLDRCKLWYVFELLAPARKFLDPPLLVILHIIAFKMRLKCVTDKSELHLLTLNCWKSISTKFRQMLNYDMPLSYLSLPARKCLNPPILVITVCNSSCGKVMFSQACIKNSVHGGEVYTPVGRHPAAPSRGRPSMDRHPSRQLL